MTAPSGLLEQGIEEAKRGNRTEARDLLMRLVEAEPENELAWIWLSGLVDSWEDKIIACENVLALNPSNEQVQAYLYTLLREQKKAHAGQPARSDRAVAAARSEPPEETPLRTLAGRYESQGKLDDAIQALADLASQTRDSREFDRIYREITRLESLQRDQIQHIAPASTILRMTLSWPLLYLFLAVLQTGLKPFGAGAWYLWAGLPVVAIGAFLLALAEVRAPHAVWRRLFSAQYDSSSGVERVIAGAAGWFLVGVPHALLLVNSLNRLSVFRVPYPPLPGG